MFSFILKSAVCHFKRIQLMRVSRPKLHFVRRRPSRNATSVSNNVRKDQLSAAALTCSVRIPTRADHSPYTLKRKKVHAQSWAYARCLSPLRGPWAHRWINHKVGEWHMASASHSPDCDCQTVIFPASERHRRLTGTKLYCLVTEAHRCK